MSAEAPLSPKPERAVTLYHPRQGWLTYETFYGLKDKPFGLSSDPAFFYSSRSHAAAFDDLLSGIRRRESLSVVSGDIGTGKTTLCRTVLKYLDRQTFSAFVPDPFATREDLLKVVLADFGVVSADDLATGRLRGASRTELSFLLYEFLATLSPLQAFAVIFVDEAQNLSLPLLEEIRILSDSDGRERQLQVVLVGQLELRDKLRLPEMRQVAQRVCVQCGLEPLDRDGVSGYIAHRLHVAGGSPDRVRFSCEAVDAIYEASGGVPRLVNRLCDRALHHGALRRTAVIDRDTVGLVGEEVDTATRSGRDLRPRDERPSASVLQNPLPSTTTVRPATHDVADAWLNEFEARVEESQRDARATTAERESAAEPRDDTEAPVGSILFTTERRSRTVVPLTHMEMLQRKWLRRLKIAVMLLVIAVGAGAGLSLAIDTLMQKVASPRVETPVLLPMMPATLLIPVAPADPVVDANGLLTPPANPSSY